jgi:hypothetical protein
MDCITIQRGNDGFGSQLFSIISGLSYCVKNNCQYTHSQINNIKLIDKDEFQNDELSKSNLMINEIIENLGMNSERTDCRVYPFLHNHIFDNDVDKFFTEDFIKSLNKSYPYPKPDIFKNGKINIAIHIRRGDDIPTTPNPNFIDFQQNYFERWIKSEVYDELIFKLNEKIPNAMFHIFSWNNPQLKISLPNIVYHTVTNGEKFIDDFNLLVHSDLLVVGSSTFSISAGFFNSNKVICHDSLCKLPKTPIPSIWVNNYHKILENEHNIN